jgi:hypothetical protein
MLLHFLKLLIKSSKIHISLIVYYLGTYFYLGLWPNLFNKKGKYLWFQLKGCLILEELAHLSYLGSVQLKYNPGLD